MSALPIDRQKEVATPRDVVFVESAGAMGGVQFSTLYLVQRLDRTRWTPIVVCPEDGDLTRACHDAGVETHTLKHPGLRSTSLRAGRTRRVPNPAAWAWNVYALSAAARKLKRFLARSHPALVVTKGLSAHFFGAVSARQLGIPCVWHVQDLISERSFGIYRRAFGRAAQWLPAQIIVDGASIAEQLPCSVQSRVTVIHNGVDTSVFQPEQDGAAVRRELGIPDEHLVIGNLGRVTPWKGQHHLIEAFARIVSENPEVTLLFVGSPAFDNDSYQRRLIRMVEQLNLTGRVKFAGYRHDTASVLAAMDVFAFTSIEKDTSPLALLSAMSCGLPIAAFDIAGVRELMANKDIFRLAPVEDVAALGRVLSEMLSDKSLRQRLGAAARQQAISEFSLDKYADRIEQIFRIALKSVELPAEMQGIPEVSPSDLRDCA